jgi:hypothetical protein
LAFRLALVTRAIPFGTSIGAAAAVVMRKTLRGYVATSPRMGSMIGVGMPSIAFTVGSAYRAAIMGDCADLVEWGRGGRPSERQGFRCVDLGEKGPGGN